MLGHILSSDERSPAQVAPCFVIQQCEENVGRLGCHKRNLLHQFKKIFIIWAEAFIYAP